MEQQARSAAFSALTLSLSAATALATEQVPTLREAIRELAALSAGVVELWQLDDPAWRLLIVEQSPTLRAISVSLTPPLDDVIVTAARARQTIALDSPMPTLVLPLLAWDRVRGVLLVRAADAEVDLHSWRREFEQFSPLLALCLCSASVGQDPAMRVPESRRGEPLGRACLMEQLERELARARRARQAFPLLLLGLDRFAMVQRMLGRGGQERAIAAVAELLRATSRDGDLLGRYSDDSFLLIMPGGDSQGAAFAARRYLDTLERRPITVPGHDPLLLDLSIGIALFPVDGLTAQELIDSAGEALVVARRLGGRRAVAA